jgi:hypothetical protein
VYSNTRQPENYIKITGSKPIQYVYSNMRQPENYIKITGSKPI